ncbi:MAG: 1-(5-phosphoribosyl)-5-[(5-phosphoribosylamino)methylideneamino]imidazole-4-carboxamide isomerase [Oligoflexia bacterium]|nr:1-(5-phosphoribosyl)-5-[(5-phosphoribosylamino)methylideneamino]imidazole-4-carboxamide isomerase [Oligoflexia bacterium]
MRIYPAIDLIEGKCVRLFKGDFTKKKEYSANPVDTALSFKENGSEYIHIVDLDGAKSGNLKQIDIIKKIIKESGLKAQVGGGVRSDEAVKSLIDSGADKIIIGSLAVKDPLAAESVIKNTEPEKITLGLDIMWKKNIPRIAINGWTQAGDKDFYEVLKKYSALGIRHILCTDISRDGTLEGPNFALYKSLQIYFPELNFFASGGISKLDDIAKLKKIGLFAAITGKAIYENKFTVREALDVN